VIAAVGGLAAAAEPAPPGRVVRAPPVVQKWRRGYPEKQKGPDALTSEPLAFLLI